MTNIDLALLLYKAMNNRSFKEIDQYLNESLSFDFPGAGRVEGKRRVLIFLQALLRKYPVLCFNVYEYFADGDQVCVLWTNKGENIAGEPYENSGTTIMHIEDGKLTFISDYFKDTSFVKD